VVVWRLQVKPRTALTYSASSARQTRLRLAREVSQLDFNDFVSATVFEDDDVALGNPNLQPESTWIAELSEEWRFGELGVVKVTAFHDWISDVEDLLPLTPEFEVPGNIGDGRRWGVEVESTVPLQFIGLVGAKLDAKLRWQDSTVTDPVTGQSRVLTADGGSSQDIKFYNENRYTVILDFRQDLEEARVAWGWHYATRAERPLFKVNELEVYDEGTQLNAFIETTRWWGLKIRFTANNILDVVDTRNRTIYTGERDLSPVDYRELRTLTNGTRLILSFSGAF
jgi:outer membrane receptor protein involved in Fe transport